MQQSLPTWFVVLMFWSALADGPLGGRVAGQEYTADLRCIWFSLQVFAGTMTPSVACLRIWCWYSEPLNFHSLGGRVRLHCECI